MFVFFFFFNDTATTEIYTLSLHDALPISPGPRSRSAGKRRDCRRDGVERLVEALSRRRLRPPVADRKSTRLNSSHLVISYAVFCLKKKKTPSSEARPPTRPATRHAYPRPC